MRCGYSSFMKPLQFNDNFEISITTLLDEPDDIEALSLKVAKTLKIAPKTLPPLEIKRKSIDARNRRVCLVFTLGIRDDQRDERLKQSLSKEVKGEPIIIVGAGPAGLFCAYELARLGIASIICERGKMVQERRKDLKGLNQHGMVDEDSNYCFGEGGAGTYSDGKLYTRSHKRGNVREVLEILVAHGANPAILTDARPHIGSNQLPKVITALRQSLERVGVLFNFGAKVVDITCRNKEAKAVKLDNGRQLAGRAIVLATGHSARDIYELLYKIGVVLTPKDFAMGVRVEHPQALINHIQYGKDYGHKKLPPAYYRLAFTPPDKRGAFSFCMCPGGWIVPASTNSQELVVNGMSLSKRDSIYANSGLVVAIRVGDLQRLGYSDALAGIRLQKQLENTAMKAGGGALVAPAIKVSDFVANKLSNDLPSSSYLPGLNSADLNHILKSTGLPVASRLKEALLYFNRLMPGYISDEAVMVGVESRTSSPVRINRDENTLCSNIKALYPCGEGAGYAGGIVSAAIDGINVARKIKDSLSI